MSGLGVIHGAANGCARCGQQFGAVTAFDKHQDVDYDRVPVVICRDPATLNLAQDGNGVWRMPVKDPDWGRKRQDAAARRSDSEMRAEQTRPGVMGEGRPSSPPEATTGPGAA